MAGVMVVGPQFVNHLVGLLTNDARICVEHTGVKFRTFVERNSVGHLSCPTAVGLQSVKAWCMEGLTSLQKNGFHPWRRHRHAPSTIPQRCMGKTRSTYNSRLGEPAQLSKSCMRCAASTWACKYASVALVMAEQGVRKSWLFPQHAPRRVNLLPFLPPYLGVEGAVNQGHLAIELVEDDTNGVQHVFQIRLRSTSFKRLRSATGRMVSDTGPTFSTRL